MKHLILGNGAAGISAAEKLRELSSSDEITIVSNENMPVYTKPMLPDYIGGKLLREKLFIRDFDAYREKEFRFIQESGIEKIDRGEKLVVFSGGKTESYDKLLIATGGIPFIPPIEGLKNISYFTVNSVRDADIIKEEASKGGKATVVGGGLTGIEVGFALNRLGMKVTIIEREDRILPVQLDIYSSSVLVEIMKKEGIEVLTGKTVAKCIKEGRKYIELADGGQVGFDMLVVTIGTRPNIGFLGDSDIKTNRGIQVDEFLRTSAEDVYAAGDVAETVNKVSGGYVSSYIWPNAMAQGKCAAYNMSGQPTRFDFGNIMANATILRDTPFISMGLINPAGPGYEVFISHERDAGTYKKLVLKHNIIVGMIFIGDTGAANRIGGYIRKGADVSGTKDLLLGEIGFNKA